MIDETSPSPAEYQQDTGQAHIVNCPHCTLRTALAPFCGQCGTHMASSTPTVWDQDAMSSVYSQAAAAGEGTSSSGRGPTAAQRRAVIDGHRGPETFADHYAAAGTPDYVARAIAAKKVLELCERDAADAEAALRAVLPAGLPGRTLDEAIDAAKRLASGRAMTSARQREHELLMAAVSEWRLATMALEQAREDSARAEAVYDRVVETARSAINRS